MFKASRRRVLAALYLFVACSLAVGCSIGRHGSRSSTSLSPINGEKVCGIVSNATLKNDLSLDIVKYGYENSPSMDLFSCTMFSSSEAGMIRSMTIEYQPTKATRLNEITDQYSNFLSLSIEVRGGGQGWVMRDYSKMIWIYPDGHYLEVYAFDLGVGKTGGNSELREGLTKIYRELTNDVPDYSRTAGSIPYTSVSSEEEGDG